MNIPLKPIRIAPDSGKAEESGMEPMPKLRLRADSRNTSASSMAESSDEMPNATAMASAAMPVHTRYQCPHCGAMLETDEAVEGNRVPCPECGQEFVATPIPKLTLQPIQPSLSSAGKTFRRKKGKAHIALWIFVALVLLAGGFAGAWCMGIVQHIQSPEQNGQSCWTARTGGVTWSFTVDGVTIAICGVEGVQPGSNLEIPAFFGWRRTASIGKTAFMDCKMKSVRIPNGVTNIGDCAFADCSELTAIDVPDSVRELGAGAFGSCESLTRANIGNGVTNIGHIAFGLCHRLSDLTIGNGVVNIESNVFVECVSLESVCIPENVEQIGDAAFQSCSNLVSVTLPPGVRSIGDRAFHKTALTSIDLPDSVRSLGNAAFAVCPRLTSAKIGKGVTEIGISLFNRCEALSSLEMGPNVTHIGAYAFFKCSHLQSVVLPDSVTNIAYGAFGDCTSLASIQLPEKLERFEWKVDYQDLTPEYGVFEGCVALTNVAIPSKVDSVSGQLFAQCKKLNSVSLPEGLKLIFVRAFQDCEELSEINIPKSVNEIWVQAFEGCKSLKAVELPDGLELVYQATFKDCTSLASVDIPDSVREIFDEAFSGCTSLATLTIPNSVTNIGEQVFENCRALEAMTLPDSVQGIGANAFSGCVGLQTLHVPASWRGRNMLAGTSLPDGCMIVYGDSDVSETAAKAALPELSVYDPVIDLNLERNIRLSGTGPYLGAILHVVSQGTDGQAQARKLAKKLSGRTKDEISAILSASGYQDVEEVVSRMSRSTREAAAASGYQYINRLKFWQAATIESLFGDYYANRFEGLTAGYLRGRLPRPANLSKGDMPEILAVLGISPGDNFEGTRKQLAKYASHFNLEKQEDRDAFAKALVEGCVAFTNKNLNLKKGMSTDEVFKRIKDIGAILSQESGSPLVPGDVGPTDLSTPVLPEFAGLAEALEAAKEKPTGENYKRVVEAWMALPEKEKRATQKSVLWAYCAMLWSKGNTAAAEKRQGAINYPAFLNAVTDPCRSCGGRGSKRETCRYCGGTGVVKSGGSGSGSCSFCHGSGQVGGRLGGHPSTCPKCGGSGKSASVSGGKKACPNCTGGTISESCRTCGGTGRIYSASKCKRVVEENLEAALAICHGGREEERGAEREAAADDGGDGWL